jgi:hypothetical protein
MSGGPGYLRGQQSDQPLLSHMIERVACVTLIGASGGDQATETMADGSSGR